MTNAAGISRAWFWTTAGVLFLFIAASAAPSTLYHVYQQKWAFSATTLTAVFAVYVAALLVALVFFGSLSDHLGRRPIMFAGLLLEAGACLVFVFAGGVDALFLARAVQGLAVGLTAGALNAALLDMRPDGKVAPLIASTSSTAGLAFGALATSVLVQYGPAPTHLPWWLFLGGFIAGLGVIAAMPEPGEIRPGTLPSLRPHVSVPKQARGAFVLAMPCVIGSWALGGFYLSLGPSLVAEQLKSTNLVWGGLAIFVLCGIGAFSAVARSGQEPRRIMLEGCIALFAGGAVSFVAIATESPAVLFVGTAIAGIGFGPAFLGAFRTVVTLAPVDDRAGLVSAIFIVTYTAFGVPALAAGFATSRYGLRPTALAYCAIVVTLTGVAALALLVERRRQGASADADSDVHSCLPAAPCTRAHYSRSAGVPREARTVTTAHNPN